MIYTKALEDVDKRRGRLATIEDWKALSGKPAEELTQDDLVIIENFGGPASLQAAIARRDAVLFPTPDPVPRKKAAPAVPMMGSLSQEAVATGIAQTIKAVLAAPTAKLARLEAIMETLLGDKAKLRDKVHEAVVERSKSVTHTEALETRVKALEEIVADRLNGLAVVAIDSKPPLRFCGVFRADARYEPGDAVTHAGGLWVCKAAPAGKPSEDFAGWVLAVKRGSTP